MPGRFKREAKEGRIEPSPQRKAFVLREKGTESDGIGMWLLTRF